MVRNMPNLRELPLIANEERAAFDPPPTEK